MATRKCRNIYFPKYCMASGSSQIFILSRFFFVLLLILIVGSRIHYSSFASYVICHYYIKKSYGPTERGIVT